MNSKDLQNLQEAYLEVYGEGYIDYRKGKLPSGKTPREAATGKHEILKARAAKARTDNPDGSALGGSEEEVSRRRRQGATTREMDSHTGLGGVVNRALSPGLGNRAGASPRMNRGEPNTERHQRGIDRRERAQRREEIELYNILLSHLLDEGYADTQESAEVIMVNMSEDWRESIFETIASSSVTRSIGSGPIPTKRPQLPSLGNLGQRAGTTIGRAAGGLSNVPFGRQVGGMIGGQAGKTLGDKLQNKIQTSGVQKTIGDVTSKLKSASEPSGGYSTRPGDGKPYRDGPLWGPGSSDSNGSNNQPNRQKPPKDRDEPLW